MLINPSPHGGAWSSHYTRMGGGHHGESKGNKLVCESDINPHSGTKQPDRSACADGSAPLLVLGPPPALSTPEKPQSACSVSPSWKAPCVLLHVGDGRTQTKENHPQPNHIFALLITTGPMNVGYGCVLVLEATTRRSPLWSALGCDHDCDCDLSSQHAWHQAYLYC